MVTINFTLFVELFLFLIFLWGTQIFAIRPLLKVMDDRDEYVGQNQQRAAVDEELAGAQESRYADELIKVRRKIEDERRNTIRAAQDEQTGLLADKRQQAHRAVEIAREQSVKAIAEQRASYSSLAPEIAQSLIKRLELGEQDQ